MSIIYWPCVKGGNNVSPYSYCMGNPIFVHTRFPIDCLKALRGLDEFIYHCQRFLAFQSEMAAVAKSIRERGTGIFDAHRHRLISQPGGLRRNIERRSKTPASFV